MDLTLAQAAARLQLTERQVRYRIKTGRLAAHKSGDRWVVREGDLPVPPLSAAREAEKAAALQQTVHAALAPHVAVGRSKVWTVERMRAFGAAVAAHRSLKGVAAPRAQEALVDCVRALARANHAFGRHAKRGFLTEARNCAADAVALLWLEVGGGEAAAQLEADVLPHIAGLLRVDDKGDT